MASLGVPITALTTPSAAPSGVGSAALRSDRVLDRRSLSDMAPGGCSRGDGTPGNRCGRIAGARRPYEFASPRRASECSGLMERSSIALQVQRTSGPGARAPAHDSESERSSVSISRRPSPAATSLAGWLGLLAEHRRRHCRCLLHSLTPGRVRASAGTQAGRAAGQMSASAMDDSARRRSLTNIHGFVAVTVRRSLQENVLDQDIVDVERVARCATCWRSGERPTSTRRSGRHAAPAASCTPGCAPVRWSVSEAV